MSKSKLRVAISLNSAIILIASAGMAMAKPPKKTISDTAIPVPKNEPVANIAQSAPTSAPEPAKEEQIPPPTMDTNADGKADAWDRDGNGVVDAWDTDGDSKPDALDNDNDGKPDAKKAEDEMRGPDAPPQ